MKSTVFLYSCLVIFILLTVLLQACNSAKNVSSIVYFNEPGDTALAKIIQNAEPVIKPGDRLGIVVNATDPSSAAPYNLGSSFSAVSSAGAAGSSVSGSGNNGYLVEADGTIQFPQFGKLQVAGLQRKQLIDMLTKKLLKLVNDPIVTIQFLNFKITVLGEVGKPGPVAIPDGKVNIIDAIGLAGDLPLTARRDNIMVIRENNGQREFGYVNLLSKNIFSSPYYILKQNDVVYVELTKAKVAANNQTTNAVRNNISLITTVLSVVSTVIVLIFTFKK